MKAEEIKKTVEDWAELKAYSVEGFYRVGNHLMISISGDKNCKSAYEELLKSHNLEHTAICADAFGFGTYIKID